MMQALLSIGLVFSIRLAMVLAFPVTSSGLGFKNIVIDTDLLSFPDDAGAIGIANAFQQLGLARILGIASDVNSRYSVPAINAICSYYGHSDIPFGRAPHVTNATVEPDINPPLPDFITTLANSSIFPEDGRTTSTPLSLYRRILSNAEDNSVTIASIGFFKNLAELYNSPGGRDLIKSKVAELVVQGGSFSSNQDGPTPIGYNLVHSFPGAKVLEEWPSPVTYLGDDVGATVISGASLIDTPSSNPVKEAFAIFFNGVGNTGPSWDIMTLFYAVLGIYEGSFEYGNKEGRIQIFDNGTAKWNHDVKVPQSRRQQFLTLRESNITIGEKLDRLLAVLPDIYGLA